MFHVIHVTNSYLVHFLLYVIIFERHLNILQKISKTYKFYKHHKQGRYKCKGRTH